MKEHRALYVRGSYLLINERLYNYYIYVVYVAIGIYIISCTRTYIATYSCSQVSTNGLLSFEKGFDSYIISQFPRTASPSIPLIAPLWADFNFRDAGTLYYRVTTDASILDAVVEDRNEIYGEYRPTMAVVVTWFVRLS